MEKKKRIVAFERLFEAGRLLTFSAFRIGAYSKWALIWGWVLIRINTVISIHTYYFENEGEARKEKKNFKRNF